MVSSPYFTRREMLHIVREASDVLKDRGDDEASHQQKEKKKKQIKIALLAIEKSVEKLLEMGEYKDVLESIDSLPLEVKEKPFFQKIRSTAKKQL